MNCFAIRLALKRLGFGLALVCIVGLLTLIFNFLGTITCAVLLGMKVRLEKPCLSRPDPETN